MEIINRIIIFVLLIALLITLYKHQQYVNETRQSDNKHEKKSTKHKKEINKPVKKQQQTKPTKKPIKKILKKPIINESVDSNSNETNMSSQNDSISDIKQIKHSDELSNDSIGSNFSFLDDDDFFFQK